METGRACEQRRARMREIFGTDDLALVTEGLRDRRKAVLLALLRRTRVAVAPGRGTAVRLRALARAILAGAQPQR